MAFASSVGMWTFRLIIQIQHSYQALRKFKDIRSSLRLAHGQHHSIPGPTSITICEPVLERCYGTAMATTCLRDRSVNRFHNRMSKLEKLGYLVAT